MIVKKDYNMAYKLLVAYDILDKDNKNSQEVIDSLNDSPKKVHLQESVWIIYGRDYSNVVKFLNGKLSNSRRMPLNVTNQEINYAEIYDAKNCDEVSLVNKSFKSIFCLLILYSKNKNLSTKINDYS